MSTQAPTLPPPAPLATVEDDERRGVPSASYMERLSLCPGSWKACAEAPPDEGSPDADRGTRIHAVLAGEAGWDTLAPDEAATAESLQEKFDALVSSVFGDSEVEIIREKRLWWGNRVSGKSDAIVLCRPLGLALVGDYKTGRGTVEDNPTNLQLRTLAFLVRQKWPEIDTVAVAIIQDGATPKEPVYYDKHDLTLAGMDVARILAEAHKPDAPRKPGPVQCKYCAARFTCPEAAGYALQAAVAHDLPSLPAEKVADLLDRCEIAVKLIDRIKSTAKDRLRAGEEIPGWKIQTTKGRTQVTDIATVCRRAQDHGITPQQFASGCSITQKALETLLRGAGLKGKGLTAAKTAVLEGCTETGADSERMVRA